MCTFSLVLLMLGLASMFWTCFILALVWTKRP